MTLRLLLSIGCNDYTDHQMFGQLTGAHEDAQQVFDALINPACGEYDPNKSKLLLSPTSREMHEALRTALFEVGVVDTLTIYFAGHGVLKKESFFLCLKDSRYEALSASAVSLSALLQMIAEAGPAQANIIIDACESGGLVGDLGAILKHDVLGKGGSPSVTLVAASGSDQQALETDAGGIATRALLACISGTTFVQNSGANLDLVDIGRVISSEVSRCGGQTPFVWGLNLFGPARFCLNPHHTAASSAALHQVGGGIQGAQAAAIREVLPTLYRLYEDANRQLDLQALNKVISSVVDADFQQPRGAAVFVSRLQSALRERTNSNVDTFAAIEASATCLVPLLRSAASSTDVQRFVLACVAELGREVVGVLSEVADVTETDKFALLAANGLADLFYLPMRLTKALGWAGAVYCIQKAAGENTDETELLLRRFGETIIRDYSTAFRAVSDAQSPYMAAALAAFRDADLLEIGETLLSLMFSSVIRCSGHVARNDLTPDEIFEYLQISAKQEWVEKRGLVSQPSELILVLLAFAPTFLLADTFDYEMRRLDHVALNAFVPARWEDFGQEVVSDGINHTIKIGHHFFRVAEVVTRLESISLPTPPNIAVGALAILAGLIFPDRTPWFVWQWQSRYRETFA